MKATEIIEKLARRTDLLSGGINSPDGDVYQYKMDNGETWEIITSIHKEDDYPNPQEIIDSAEAIKKLGSKATYYRSDEEDEDYLEEVFDLTLLGGDHWIFDNGVEIWKEEWDYDLCCFKIEYMGKSHTLVPDSLEQMEEIIDALNSGKDLISSGWETGDGETIKSAMMGDEGE